MKLYNLSSVEQFFFLWSGQKNSNAKMPYLVVPNFPKLGLITALRFLEWVAENPNGVISLTVGKTTEYIEKRTHYLLNNWNDPKVISIKKLKRIVY
jgi:glucosamine-6-phosphate deaminase